MKPGRVRERFIVRIAGVGSASGVRVVASTYSFDEQVIEPVSVEDTADGWQVSTPSLSLRLVVGGRTPLGAALGLVPARVATSPAWCAVIDPVARTALRGVRTRGTAGGDRREWYGATSMSARPRPSTRPVGSASPRPPSGRR